MKKLVTKTIVVLIVLFSFYSCSKSKDSEPIIEPEAIDTDEYYIDSSGKYVLQLGDEGYNIYMDGKPYETNIPSISAVKSPKITSTDIKKEYQYPYKKGICVFPPAWPRGKNNPPLSSLPNKQAVPGKKTITCNFKTIGGGYRVTPKPAFLGGSNYACYECLIESIDRNDFFVGVCNGSVFISGSLSDAPSIQSLKTTLLGVNFNPSQSEQFVQSLNSTGVYKCTKR
jgi:hypothetical protein